MKPKSIEAEAVPARIEAPPPTTVMKALATKADPMVGDTPETGASNPPARPVTAAPIPNVAM